MTRSSLDIHPMTPADYDEVVAFWRTIEGLGLDDDTDSRQGIVAYLNRNPGLSFIVRREGSIIGAVLSGHDGRRGYLHHLAVAPDCRHQGIGRALVDACLSGLGKLGIQKCNIFLLADNELGKSFWKHNAWTERDDLKVLQKAHATTVLIDARRRNRIAKGSHGCNVHFTESK